jgi:predicted RNase H-like HicB family nuclease
MSQIIWENGAVTPKISGDWKETKGYRFHLSIIRDDAESVSVIVLNLPGTGSCGSTEEEALENVNEAIRGALEAYRESGQSIPWKDTSREAIPKGVKQKWIILDA